MDDALPPRFSRAPACAQQRREEAPRAVCVGGLCQEGAARRFGYSPGGCRLLVRPRRAAGAAGAAPPFSPGHPGDGRRPTRRGVRRPRRTSQRSPAPGR